MTILNEKTLSDILKEVFNRHIGLIYFIQYSEEDTKYTLSGGKGGGQRYHIHKPMIEAHGSGNEKAMM